jgi:hypothetical protein
VQESRLNDKDEHQEGACGAVVVTKKASPRQ